MHKIHHVAAVHSTQDDNGEISTWRCNTTSTLTK